MRLVIKIGSNIITKETGLDTRRISSIVTEIAKLHSEGHEIAVVSSGAVAAGVRKLGLKKRPTEIRQKQAAAAAGQSSLVQAYEKAFGRHKKKVAQILITRDAFHDRYRYINARNTIMTLFDYRVIPIINENDSVSIEEIKFGDNDQLASLVAGLISADRLIILSDVDGLYTKDPSRFPDAELIPLVEEITVDLKSAAGREGSMVGTGGMISKLIAAEKAMRLGIVVNIINGRKQKALRDLLSGKRVGTEFKPSAKRVSSRKGWLAFGVRTKGSVVIDSGATEAIIRRGKSLLPSGIIDVEGSFNAGDAIYCTDQAGRKIAKGLSNYSSHDIQKIRGLKTSEIEKVLGYKYSDEVIHRDNLFLLSEG
ncbi:MAG: glutamate 5-kinase [Nitrospirae bacterium]|nr:MAG: glutamate 5-kinase [Nitrospirota bacterium]